MKPQINPAWLVSLMTRWALRQLAGETSSLGYPGKSAGFSEKTTGGYNHSNPTAFGVEDFRDLEVALNKLRNTHEAQFVAISQYYKPWIVRATIAEGWPFNNSTYYKRLHAAHGNVAAYMDASKIKVKESAEYV